VESSERNCKTVVVLGKARSGTSITAGLLNILGVDMGGDRSPTPFNPHGAYEDLEFNDLNSEILEAAGGDEILSPPSIERVIEQREEFDDRIQRFFAGKRKQHIWGWKKPSTVFLFDLFLPYLTNPHLVVVGRNPIGNALSLVEFLKHKYPSLTFIELLRVVKNLDKEIFCCAERHKEIPTIFVTFEDIITNPIKEADRICRFLDLTLNRDKVKRINEFLIPREKIWIQKQIGFIRSFPRKSLKLMRKCYREPTKTGEYLLQSVRLFRNRVFGNS